MNEIRRYYPSPSILSSDPLDRYIARQQVGQRVAWTCLLGCLFLAPALLGWGFGSGAGQMAAWILYKFVIYISCVALAGLFILTMFFVAHRLTYFFQNRRY